MSRTEEQKEAEKLLNALEDAAALSNIEAPVRAKLLDVVKLCRLQQREIEDLQDIPRNIGLGLRVVAAIGAFVAFVITTTGGVLAIKGYFKG